MTQATSLKVSEDLDFSVEGLPSPFLAPAAAPEQSTPAD
jgi:hypothetical protein